MTREDYISKQAVLSKIKEVCFSKEWAQFRTDYGSNGQRDFLINYIEQLPLVTPQPKTAHWVSKGDVYPAWRHCSNCNEPWTFDCGLPNYCPVCGTKMESGK